GAPSRVTDHVEDPVASPIRPPRYHPFQSKRGSSETWPEGSGDPPAAAAGASTHAGRSSFGWTCRITAVSPAAGSGRGTVATGRALVALGARESNHASCAIPSRTDRRFIVRGMVSAKPSTGATSVLRVDCLPRSYAPWRRRSSCQDRSVLAAGRSIP